MVRPINGAAFTLAHIAYPRPCAGDARNAPSLALGSVGTEVFFGGSRKTRIWIPKFLRLHTRWLGTYRVTVIPLILPR